MGEFTSKSAKIIYARSGNKCAFPDCIEILVKEGTEFDNKCLISELAHIKGEREHSPRYDSKITEKECDDPSNGIAFCRNHHKLIDDQENTYTVEKLIEIKKNHETWVEAQMNRNILNITFAELEVITKYLISCESGSTEIKIIKPAEKIRKNQLSLKIENLIIQGMARVNLVSNYIKSNKDSEFGERMKSRFIELYKENINEGRRGDDLFLGLLDSIGGKNIDMCFRAAALAVLCYYFESCDIFEK